MIQVYVDGDINSALLRLKREVTRDGILKQLKLRSRFETRSQRRKRKNVEALRRLKRRRARSEQNTISQKRTQQWYAAERKAAEKQHVASTEPAEVNTNTVRYYVRQESVDGEGNADDRR